MRLSQAFLFGSDKMKHTTARIYRIRITIAFFMVFLAAPLLLLADTPKASPNLPTTEEIKGEMQTLYQSFHQLFRHSINEKKFLSGEIDGEIQSLLADLENSFHKDELRKSRFSSEPTYRFLLQSIARMVEDANTRFKEGERGYALWQIKSFSQYCISCHTRLKGAEFPNPSFDEQFLSEIKDPLVIADYLLASRQFERAAAAFLSIAKKSEIPYERDRMLAKWLTIKVRVGQNPTVILEELRNYKNGRKLSRRENSELFLWEQGLKRWEKDAQTPIENLLQSGLNKEQQISGGGVIELLRVTATIHRELNEGTTLHAKNEAEKLLLLAQAYRELPGYFMYELPEMLLERAIRLQADTELARKSFLLLREILIGAYSGSGGTYLPDDVKLHLRELEDIAYGIPGQETGRV